VVGWDPSSQTSSFSRVKRLNQEFRLFSFAAAEVFTTVLPCGGPFLAQTCRTDSPLSGGDIFGFRRHGLRNEHNQYKGAARNAAARDGLFWLIFNTDSMQQ